MLFGNIDYFKPATAAGIGALNNANDGLSVDASGLIARLGQPVGAAGDPAKLLENREIPFNNFSIKLKDPVATTFGNLSPTQITFSGAGAVAGGLSGSRVFGGSGTNSFNLQANDANAFNMTGSKSGLYWTVQDNGSIAGSSSPGRAAGLFISYTLPAAGGTSLTFFYSDIALQTQLEWTSGSNSYIGVDVNPSIDNADAPWNGNMMGVYYRPTGAGNALSGKNIAWQNDSGDCYFNAKSNSLGLTTGRCGFQKILTPTAYIHIGAGLATAGNAPLKFTAGANLTTPENGAMEFDGTHLYITIGGVRTTIV